MTGLERFRARMERAGNTAHELEKQIEELNKEMRPPAYRINRQSSYEQGDAEILIELEPTNFGTLVFQRGVLASEDVPMFIEWLRCYYDEDPGGD